LANWRAASQIIRAEMQALNSHSVEPIKSSFADITVGGFSYFSVRFIIFMLDMLKVFYLSPLHIVHTSLVNSESFCSFSFTEFLKTLTLALFL
jgi:hypothetical protein